MRSPLKDAHKKGLTLAFLAMVLASTAFGYSPSTPYPYVAAAPNYYFFAMTPVHDATLNNGSGVAYQIEDNGTFKEMWRVTGWYAFPGKLFFSPNGDTVARLVDLPQSPDPELSECILLEFYREGQKVRSYRCKDLLQDMEKGLRPLHHDPMTMTFLEKDPEMLMVTQIQSRWKENKEALAVLDTIKALVSRNGGSGPERFLTIETIEGGRLAFQMSTGELVLRIPPKKQP